MVEPDLAATHAPNGRQDFPAPDIDNVTAACRQTMARNQHEPGGTACRREDSGQDLSSRFDFIDFSRRILQRARDCEGILHRLGSAPEAEAIAGDLLEQYQQGRSRLWYWREVIVAILTGTWSEVQQHSLLVLASIAMAWILKFASRSPELLGFKAIGE